MQISEKKIKMARDKFREISGITIYTPDEGGLDDFEQARYDAWFSRSGGRAFNMGKDDAFWGWMPKLAAPAAKQGEAE